MVGKKLLVLYDNGWFTGDVTYFNQKFNKLRLAFTDESDDYVEINEIDGIEIIRNILFNTKTYRIVLCFI